MILASNFFRYFQNHKPEVQNNIIINNKQSLFTILMNYAIQIEMSVGHEIFIIMLLWKRE